MKRVFLIAVVAYVALCGWVAFIQRGLLYFPTHRAGATSLEMWMHDSVQHGYKREVRGATQAWLFLHGNAGQASEREFILRKFDQRDSVYVLEYPGFGARGGKPTEEAINAAARQAYLSLVMQKRYDRVGVVGESLGSGPASFLATLDPAPSKVVLLVPYDEIVAVAAERYPWLPARLIMLDQWNNSRALENYPGPVEIYAAERDTVIPPRHAIRLHEKLPRSKLVMFPAGHNDWPDRPEVQIRFP